MQALLRRSTTQLHWMHQHRRPSQEPILTAIVFMGEFLACWRDRKIVKPDRCSKKSGNGPDQHRHCLQAVYVTNDCKGHVARITLYRSRYVLVFPEYLLLMSRIVVAATQILSCYSHQYSRPQCPLVLTESTPYTTWACVVLVKVTLDGSGRSDVFAQSAHDRIEPECATVKPLTGGSKVVGLMFGSGFSASQRHIRHRQQKTQTRHMFLTDQSTGSLPAVITTSIGNFVVATAQDGARESR